MCGEKDLRVLLSSIDSQLHEGQFVFCTVQGTVTINLVEAAYLFKEEEDLTAIAKRNGR